MLPGGHPVRSKHVSPAGLAARSEALGLRPHVRATTGPHGRLVWVLDIGPDMELTADYRSGS